MGLILSFMEILGMVFTYNVLTRNDIRKSINKSILLTIFATIIYKLLFEILSLPSLIILLIVCLLMAFVICTIEKREIYIILVSLLISGMIVSINELIAGTLIQLFLGDKYIVESTIIIGLIITTSINILWIKRIINTKKVDFNKMLSKYKALNVIIFNLFIYCLIARIFLTSGEDIKANTIMNITILGVALLVSNTYIYLYLFKTLNQMKKTEIKKSFDPLISELMLKLKSNENDYNKHLKEIYNIANSEEDKEIANEKVKVYIKNVAVDDKNFVKLLEIKNTIIKAVLYNKMQRAQKLGISYEYTVESDFRYIPVDDSELTVILSNVINNAIEATSLIKKKEMKINIYENDRKYIIEIANRIEGVKNKDLKQMFKYGYSTKGEGRGYGLYNVKNIVDKNRGRISTNIKNDIFTMEIKFNKQV